MPASLTRFGTNHTSPFMPTKPLISEFLPQPERDHIPPRDRQDRQIWPGYRIYHNRDDSISFGTEERDYFGWLPAEITRLFRSRSSTQSHPHGLQCPPHGANGSARLPPAIRSRANARAGLAALSDERLAEDDSSAADTHAGQVTIALTRKGRAREENHFPCVSRSRLLFTWFRLPRSGSTSWLAPLKETASGCQGSGRARRRSESTCVNARRHCHAHIPAATRKAPAAAWTKSVQQLRLEASKQTGYT